MRGRDREQQIESETALFKEVSDLFDEAEKSMKRLEHVYGLYIPTVNQLRYAGWHIKNYFLTKDKEELDKAKRHCKRGIYDAHDAVIQYYLHEIETFIQDYKNICVIDTYADYKELIQANDCVTKFLSETRDQEHPDEKHFLTTPESNAAYGDTCKRDQFYVECVNHSKKLQERCKDLPLIRDQLNKKINDTRKNIVINHIGIAIGVIGVVIGIIGIFF